MSTDKLHELGLVERELREENERLFYSFFDLTGVLGRITWCHNSPLRSLPDQPIFERRLEAAKMPAEQAARYRKWYRLEIEHLGHSAYEYERMGVTEQMQAVECKPEQLAGARIWIAREMARLPTPPVPPAGWTPVLSEGKLPECLPSPTYDKTAPRWIFTNRCGLPVEVVWCWRDVPKEFEHSSNVCSKTGPISSGKVEPGAEYEFADRPGHTYPKYRSDAMLKVYQVCSAARDDHCPR